MATEENIKVLAQETLQMVKDAGLRYTKDSVSGFSRIRKGEAYEYYKSDGSIIKDQKIIHRIN